MIVLQASDPTGGLVSFFPLIMIAVAFYFLILRPQQKEQKDRQAMQGALGKGDRVVTAGGIHGVIAGTEDEVVTVEIANVKGERVRMKVDRGKVERRLDAAEKGDS
jgi:preprotein translocase subunit YajC